MIRTRTIAAACVAALLAQAPGPASAQTPAPAAAPAPYVPQSGQAGKDVVWVPTAQGLVDRMLDMAQVTPADYLVDLGSGDGRTVITAAKRGVRALGIEYNPDLVTLSTQAAAKEGVSERARFVQGDIFESNFSDATVVTLFLLPALNLRLRPILLDMKPGTRVVSNSFNMGEWEPDDQVDAGGTCELYCRAYKWVIPAKVQGTWKVGDGELVLRQTFQMLDGTLRTAAGETPITNARMDGTAIRFTAGERQFQGQVEGARMSGTAKGGAQGEQPWTAAKSAP